jgi:hypothetical protein
MGDWQAPIRAYCERTGPELWAEPCNTLSNAAFFVAAAIAFMRWRRVSPKDRIGLLLIALVVLIGIGSTLFHLFANRWSALADVLPIALFIAVYLFTALRRFVGLGLAPALGWLALYEAFSIAFPAWWEARNDDDRLAGSVAYLPALLALLLMGGVLVALARRRELVLNNRKNKAWRPGPDDAERLSLALQRRQGGLLLGAGALFALSLSFRTIDQAVCFILPVGTHMVWHLLNGAVLFLCLWAAIVPRQAEAA